MKLDNILHAIGKTPLVKINHLFSNYPFVVWAKCEFLNPGGSVKDRIGYQMVIDAQRKGLIKPGDTLIEPTSGNTGIGMALAGAVLGYKVIITMPEKMSREKQVVLEALGAEIVRTPTEAAWDAPDSHIEIAKVLQKALPNAHILDQYSNSSNPDAHILTAQEIVDDLGRVPDYVVAGAGTGGTITGVAKRLKELSPSVQIVGADPVGSILAGGTQVGTYHVEGIGYDFIPDVLDRSVVDRWVKTTDAPSFEWAKKAIRHEGLLCGGSSGTALSALAQIAPEIPANSVVVVILPDGIRNYMTKFMEPRWLDETGFTGAKTNIPTLALETLKKLGLR
jgi:cystathionine beta-synthase